MNQDDIKKEMIIEERYNPRPLIFVAVVLAIIGFFFFISHRYFSLAKPIDGSIWGEFGDFIGGVIGTIIAYISIRLLVATLNTQSLGNNIAKEAADLSLYESKLQRLYSNFKMMLELYRSTLARFNMDDEDPQSESGLEFLKKKCYDMTVAFNSQDNSYIIRNDEAIKSFNDFYSEFRPVASVYFRIIYRMLELIFTADIDSEDKAKFAKMLRCQLSEEELFFIRYNVMTNNGANMRKYINQYNLMKHLPELTLLEFKYHIIAELDDKDKNQMTSALIVLRKALLKRDKFAPNETIIPIHKDYTIDGVMNADRHQYTLTLQRPAVNLPADINNNESFDKLTREQLCAFMHDFITELFTSYNFCIYQNFRDIIVDDSQNTENGYDSIVITVTTEEADRKLYLYKDQDPQTSEEYDN